MIRTLLVLLALGAACIANAQIITTIAGTGAHSFTGDGGPATAATLYPGWLTLDKYGNVYVSADNYVRIIDRKGFINAFAGGGGTGTDGDPATAVNLFQPSGVCIGANGNVYIGNQGGANRVRMVDKYGIIHAYAGGGSISPGDGGPATAAGLLGGLANLFAISGDVYISEGTVLRKVDASGIITTIAGTGSTGYSGDGVPATSATYMGGAGIVKDISGNIFLTDHYNNTIRKINTAGIISTIAGDGWPVGSFSGDGGPASAAKLNVPDGIAIDPAGDLYICDANNYRIRKIDSKTGIISTVAGNGTSAFSGDGGPATAAHLGPFDLAIDCGGNIYLSDQVNYRVRKITYKEYLDFVSEDNTLMVCQNSGATNIDNLLDATDIGVGQPVDWAVYASPMHGTVSGSYSTTSTGGKLTPSGFTYTPTSGYSGTDSFTMLVGPCAQVGDLHRIYVTVNPLPGVAAITGTETIVCLGKTITLANATAGGVWSAASTSVSVSAGTVTGVSAGTTTVSYTVTVAGCATSVAYPVTVKNCNVGVANISALEGLLVYPNPVKDIIHIEGINSRISYRLSNMVGSVVGTGALDNVHNAVNVGNVVKGVYMLELTDAATGLRITKRVVKE